MIKNYLQVIVHCEYMEQKWVHELWVTLLCLKKNVFTAPSTILIGGGGGYI